MKFNLSHWLYYLIAFGGAVLIAYDGAARSGAPLTLTLPVIIGLVMSAIGIFAATMNKQPVAPGGGQDNFAALLQTLLSTFQSLQQPKQAAATPATAAEWPDETCPVCKEPVPAVPPGGERCPECRLPVTPEAPETPAAPPAPAAEEGVK